MVSGNKNLYLVVVNYYDFNTGEFKYNDIFITEDLDFIGNMIKEYFYSVFVNIVKHYNDICFRDLRINDEKFPDIDFPTLIVLFTKYLKKVIDIFDSDIVVSVGPENQFFHDIINYAFELNLFRITKAKENETYVMNVIKF